MLLLVLFFAPKKRTEWVWGIPRKKYVKLGEINGIVFTKIADCLWRKLLGHASNAHGVKDRTLFGKVPTEGAGGDTRLLGQGALVDEVIFVVFVCHCFHSV